MGNRIKAAVHHDELRCLVQTLQPKFSRSPSHSFSPLVLLPSLPLFILPHLVSLDPLLASAHRVVPGVTPCLLYSMIPNRPREHFHLNLSRSNLVHSQYSRMECPIRPRGRFNARVRPPTSSPFVTVAFLTAFSVHTEFPPLRYQGAARNQLSFLII